MKNILIVAASRYGSTTQGAEWIAERLSLSKMKVEIRAPGNAPSPEGRDCVILGSPIYAHEVLPDLDNYVETWLEVLRRGRVVLFGVSMSPKPVFARGKAHGGLVHLDRLFEKLGGAVFHADMLGGQLAYDGLDVADQGSMDAFYRMLDLEPGEIERRKEPRTLMRKEDYWDFAAEIANKLERAAR